MAQFGAGRTTFLEAGHYVVYRADGDGANLQAIAAGWLDSCAPDGSWYTAMDNKGVLWRTAVAGGTPRQLTPPNAIPAGDISADSKQFLYLYQAAAEIP